MASKRTDRRRFLKEGAALAGLTGLAAAAERPASAQTLFSTAGAGYTPRLPSTDTMAYGERSRFVNAARIRMSMIGNMDMHRDPNGWDARTPLEQMVGIITPAPLHYVSSHGNPPPDINPGEHRLLIHGMVDRPLILTIDELMRFPSVSRIHYIECIYNAASPRAKTLEQGHGMISCSEWTGVLLSVLLKEVGVKAGATWVFAEGADATKHGKSVPMGKALQDVIVAYGQNGEPVRPHQGYPLRLVVPGFEGKYHVKWLKGIKVVDQPYLTYWEQSAFVADDKTKGSYFMEQGPKSVITFPSAGQQLNSRGFYTINGFAWSGGGTVRRVEVSVDGGRTWADAQLPDPPLRIALTRFQFPWSWDGKEAVLQSRCTDDTGAVQPTKADHAKFWGTSKAPHGNAIQPWRVTDGGQVFNAL
jgi:sulfane dehydrogenase subunit SoxC